MFGKIHMHKIYNKIKYIKNDIVYTGILDSDEYYHVKIGDGEYDIKCIKIYFNRLTEEVTDKMPLCDNFSHCYIVSVIADEYNNYVVHAHTVIGGFLCEFDKNNSLVNKINIGKRAHQFYYDDSNILYYTYSGKIITAYRYNRKFGHVETQMELPVQNATIIANKKKFIVGFKNRLQYETHFFSNNY